MQIGELPSIPAPAVYSFLKDTRGALTWSAQDLATTLNVSKEDADRILALLEMQGYVQSKKASEEWLTTASGEIVSGSKQPRFNRESIDKSLSTLTDRIAAINRNQRAPFKISKAIAFGDFLSGRPQVQAADVGVELRRRDPESARGHEDERAVLQQLNAKSRFVHVQRYAPWMSARSHHNLMPAK